MLAKYFDALLTHLRLKFVLLMNVYLVTRSFSVKIIRTDCVCRAMCDGQSLFVSPAQYQRCTYMAYLAYERGIHVHVRTC